MDNCLIIGGGVIGLSLAYELASHDLRVRVVDQGPIGREASWAGAGILPPASRSAAAHPYDQLCGFSHELHPLWAARLKEETGIDNGYSRCGGVYCAATMAEAAALRASVDAWREEQIRVKPLPIDDIKHTEPGLADAVRSSHIVAGCYLPDESQVRNPRHLKALATACLGRGVIIDERVEILDIKVTHGRATGVLAGDREYLADSVAITSGAWSVRLLNKLGIPTGIMPVRGQMVLFVCDRPPLRRIVNLGPRYLVPRDDGRVLVGSTEEEVGFDKRTTAEALAELRRLATDLVPALADAQVESTWAGLRPGSFDGFPYLGRVPNVDNLFVAAGHFRSGLFLSPATAIVVSQLIRGLTPEIDLSPFRVGRG